MEWHLSAPLMRVCHVFHELGGLGLGPDSAFDVYLSRVL
jgi:hypothetical protein